MQFSQFPGCTTHSRAVRSLRRFVWKPILAKRRAKRKLQYKALHPFEAHLFAS